MNNYWITNHLNLITYAPWIFFISTLVFFLVGWFHGKHRIKVNKEVVIRDALASTIFGLSALILGFTFATAVQHYNERTESIRNEALSLERVYQSTFYLNPDDQVIAKKHLKDIVDMRLDVYKNLITFDDLDNKISDVEKQLDRFNEFLNQSIPRSPESTKGLAADTLKARFNKLSDVFATAILHAKNHPAPLLERFLFIQLIIGAMLSGYSMAVKKEEDWFLTVLYLLLTGVLLYVVNCLEFPNELTSFDTLNHELIRFQKLMQ